MKLTNPILDYAPPSRRGGVRRIFFALAAVVALAVIGGTLGASVGPYFLKPAYTASGYISLRPEGERSPKASAVPVQWQLQQIVASALARARQLNPGGPSLPNTASEAFHHAGLTIVPQTTLLAVSYTADDPAAAACMAREMMDMCVTTPATDPSGTRLVAVVVSTPMSPYLPNQHVARLMGGITGMLAGVLLFVAWGAFRARWRAWAA